MLQAGEFQCYDKRALASLAEAAAAVQQPEWGRDGPHDAGEYNSWPEVSSAAAAGFLLLLQLLMRMRQQAMLLLLLLLVQVPGWQVWQLDREYLLVRFSNSTLPDLPSLSSRCCLSRMSSAWEVTMLLCLHKRTLPSNPFKLPLLQSFIHSSLFTPVPDLR